MSTNQSNLFTVYVDVVNQNGSQNHPNSKPTSTKSLTIRTRSVIYAAGAAARWLNVPGEEELKGRGVSGCAACDGYLYRGKRCAVIGGGDAAMESVLFLAGTKKSGTNN